MTATQEVLHTLNRYAATGRRLPFAICLDERARQTIIDHMTSIRHTFRPVPIRGVRELRVRGVQIGSVR